MKKINLVFLLIAFIFLQKKFAGSDVSTTPAKNFKYSILSSSNDAEKNKINSIYREVLSGDTNINCDDFQDDKNKSKSTHDLIVLYIAHLRSNRVTQFSHSTFQSNKPSGKLFILNSVLRL